MMETDSIVVFVTTKDTQEAETIARVLLEKKLIACANILPQITSQFWWEGKVQKETEAMVIIKSRRELFDVIEQEVKAQHSYDVPEIIVLPIERGNADYLQWIKEVVRKK